jgi:1-deoxy-D-xylulose-5-phosphate synthase
VAAIYSTFLQRAYDNVAHDCALQNHHVVFAIDRAGLVGEDGPTHHGVNDFAYLRHIPNMVVMAPKDGAELRDMLHSALYDYTGGPVAIRYPRGTGPKFDRCEMKSIPLGKSETLRYGSDIAILAIGKMVREAEMAADILAEYNISAEVINARFVKPLDKEMLDNVAGRFDRIITIEDHQINGGFGSAVAEYFAEMKYHNTDLIIHGIPDRFIEHGSQKLLLHDLMLDAEGIAERIKSEIFGEEIMQENIFTQKK